MKVEKKIIALCVFALIIGIATILPTVYFMDRQTGVNVSSKPWFTVDMLYADVASDILGRNRDIVTLAANFTLTSEALDLNGADAKIEVFNFHVYSDQISVANLTYCLSQAGNVIYPTEQSNVFTIAVRDLGDGCYVFADGTKFDIQEAIGYTEGIGSYRVSYSLAPSSNRVRNQSDVISFTTVNSIVGNITAFLSETKGERSAQALINSRNAQTLYIDVTRVMTATYQHQSNFDSAVSSIVTTLANSEVLSHIELTKTDSGFTYGDASYPTSNDLWVTSFEPTSVASPTASIELKWHPSKIISAITGDVADGQ